MTELHRDVVVVGAGIGGSFLAFLLGRAGLNTLVVEPGPATPSRGADFLKPRGIRVLAEHGLLESLLQRGARRRDQIRYYHDGELLHTLDFRQHTRLGYYLVVPYRVVVECITEACAALPTIAYQYSSSVTSISTDRRAGHLVELNTGQTIHTSAVIGADGPDSTVLTYVGADIDTWTYEHVVRAATLTLDSLHDQANRLYFSSDGSFGYLYPVDDRTMRVFVGLPHELDEKIFGLHQDLLVPHLASFVTHNSRELSHVNPLEFRVLPVASRLASHYVRHGAAVLGSAAFTCHPMTGQGMSYTLEDAVVLAATITDAMDNHLPLACLLSDRYGPRRDAHHRLIGYGHQLATSYPSPSAYRRAFRPVVHGGDQ